jgi:glutamine---fructose-6-phosphate transaminase (isomerizing)
MCGLFGVLLKDQTSIQKNNLEKMLNRLFILSQERGRDATGIMFRTDKDIRIIKKTCHPKDFIQTSEYKTEVENFSKIQEDNKLVIGQCRLVMSGSLNNNESNQPINNDKVVGLHNGIITKINNKNILIDSTERSDSDSKVLFDTISNQLHQGDEHNAVLSTLSSTEGSYSIACYLKESDSLILLSNTGSLYYYNDDSLLIFASEKKIVSNILDLLSKDSSQSIQQITSNKHFAVNLGKTISPKKTFIPPSRPPLKRCTSCILPHTYPFIQFDKNGVCNFCQSYKKQVLFGEEKLLRKLEKYRSKNNAPDCLVGLSGGRDSTYGLYLLKEKYGMNPIAYTFDWGLTTDTSRRNQARICGKLGIEHVIRSPDIEVRRRHVRRNVEAFLKKPHLGMVPLFMAGDKDFYHYGRKLKKELGLDLTIFCTGHEVERLHFKTGFCNVDDNKDHNVRLYNFSLMNKIKLATFYVSQYLKNPAYINESFLYSIRAFAYSFLAKDNFIYLYEYLPWEEKIVEKTIIENTNWESDQSYGKNQWRMGDGQTAFTNYIYHTVAGFSEFDNFRSNQVRSGLITRDEAIKLAAQDNEPKWETLQYFSQVIGLNLEDTIKHINNIPKIH